MSSLISTFLIGCLVGFSLILLVVSAVSYKRTKNARLLLVTGAFLVFFLKGVLLIVWLVLTSGMPESLELQTLILLDLLILVFLYFAVAKK